MSTNDEALGHLREARALLIEENEGEGRSRELSVTITNVDNAILWRQYDLQIKEPPINEFFDKEPSLRETML